MALNEISVAQVEGLNRRAVDEHNQSNPGVRQIHNLRDPGGLAGCLGGIFYQTAQLGSKAGTYIHLPIENMAGMILYRVAQGQFFSDGNKRTALLSCFVFLGNNGYILNVDKGRMNDLLWGFAVPDGAPDGTPPKYQMSDAVDYVYQNIGPRI